MEGQAHQNKLLLFQVGPVKCSLFSNDVLTIIPPPRQETAGHTGRLPGIFRHNSRIVRVVDMRSKFGLSPSSPERGRLILAEIPKGLVAFWVDQIINVIDQEEGRWDILPAALPRDVFTRTFVLDDELILHTECARMEAMRPSAELTEHIQQLQAREVETQGKLPPSAPPKAAPDAAPEAAQNSVKPAPPAADGTPVAAKPTAPLQQRQRPLDTAPAAKRETPAAPVTQARTAASPPAKRPTPGQAGTSRPGPGTGGSKPASTARPAAQPPLRERVSPATPPSRPKKPISPPRPTPRPVQTPAAVTPRPTSPTPPSRTEPVETGEGGGLGWLLLFLLLIFLAGSGALLYFTGALEQPGVTAPPPPLAEAEVDEEPPEQTPPEAPPSAPPTPVQQAMEPETPTDETVASEDAGSEVGEQQAQNPPTASAAAPPVDDSKAEAETAPPPYRASIEKDEQGLTITLEGPEQRPEGSLLQDETDGKQTESGPTDSAAGDESAPASPAAEAAQSPDAQAEPEASPEPEPRPAPKPRPNKRVITHVVVKGDTLWDIAERYVKDPFRYPELARLSGIKNPDLIYPGDIVRIIEK